MAINLMTKLLNVFRKKQISTKILNPPLYQFKTLNGDTYTAPADQMMASVGPRFNKQLNTELKSDIIIPWHQIVWIKEIK